MKFNVKGRSRVLKNLRILRLARRLCPLHALQTLHYNQNLILSGELVMKKFLRASLPALCLCALFVVVNAQPRSPLLSLDGAWQFAVDRDGELTINDLSSVKEWREIRVPLSWNAQFADLR